MIHLSNYMLYNQNGFYDCNVGAEVEVMGAAVTGDNVGDGVCVAGV
jgi:hypothetical protein